MTTMTPNTTLKLCGIIPEDAKDIRLGLGSNWKNMAFYMDVRFPTKDIVFNTRDMGKWGPPVIEPNPFNPGGTFEVTVDYTGHNFIVHINGKEVTLPNRLNIHATYAIMVGGDLEITCFCVKPTH
ncbi:galectin-1-like [Engraulis encrasicolus]|uniref:galectin-1-like n=1 Tax=Engraulis encrasicolus TaxID=184585 RepID=UPI002FD5F971